jgi:uncharacterized membrane protein YqjE
LSDEKGNILKFFKLDKLLENLTGYIETQVELIKLDVKEQAEESALRLIQLLIMLIVLGVFIVFFSLTLAVAVNILTESPYIGYITISFTYLGVLIFVLFDKKRKIGKWIFYKFVKHNKS